MSNQLHNKDLQEFELFLKDIDFLDDYSCAESVESFPLSKLDTKEEQNHDMEVPTTRLSLKSYRAKTKYFGNPNQWQPEEEVVLVGIMTDCNLFCGGQTRWNLMTVCYNHVIGILNKNRKFKKSCPQRSLFSLKKHYRAMYVKPKNFKSYCNKSLAAGTEIWFQVYHDLWLSDDFNQQGKLLNYLLVQRFSEKV